MNPSTPSRPPRRRRYALFALLALLVLFVLYIAISGISAWRQLRQLESDARALTAVRLDSLETVGPQLATISDRIDRIERTLALPLALAPYLGWVPRYGPTLVEVPNLLAHGKTLLGVVQSTWALSEPAVVALSTTGGDASPLGLLVQRVESERAGIEDNLTEIERASAYFGALDTTTLHPRLSGPLATAQPLLPLLPKAYAGLLLLPDLLERDDQTWLLLAQNNDELRPSGGFITSVGVLEIHDGVPALSSFQDSYRVENWAQPHPDPPLPLRDYMRLDLWVTRDANWWPDFPTSASAVSELYFINQGVTVDGVVAADMTAAERLLETLTPLELPNGTTIEPGTVGATFRDAWGLPSEDLVLPATPITATAPYTAVEIALLYTHQTATADFDAVSLLDADGREWVTNGSFEDDEDSNDWPDGWEAIAVGESSGLSADAPFDGERCLTLVGDVEQATIVRQRIECTGQAGDVFDAAAMARADGPQAGSQTYALRIRFMGEGEPQVTTLSYPVLAHDWASANSAPVLGEWWRHRKDIIDLAVLSAITRIAGDPGHVDWLQLVTVANDLLAERHVQVYAKNDDLQRYLVSAGWAGAMAETDGDYVLLADANMGYNKVTAVVEQSLRYEVDLTASPPEAALIVRYTNTSPPIDGPCDKFTGQNYVPIYDALSWGCYWDYVRLYVPQGSELIGVTGGDVPVATYDENSRTVYASYLVLAPGESRELAFRYHLPATVLDGTTYDLLLQRQAGSADLPLQIIITAPAGMTCDATEALTLQPIDGAWTAETDLRLDRRVRLVWPE